MADLVFELHFSPHQLRPKCREHYQIGPLATKNGLGLALGVSSVEDRIQLNIGALGCLVHDFISTVSSTFSSQIFLTLLLILWLNFQETQHVVFCTSWNDWVISAGPVKGAGFSALGTCTLNVHADR